jgi:TPR repeat protein
LAKKARKRKKRGVKAWQVLLALALLVAGIWWVSNQPSQDGRDLQSVSQEEIKLRAERGDGTAQMELAKRYCEGSGVPKNVFQCAEWYRKAANGGNGLAMLRLGDLYTAGEGFIQDKDAAAMWWRKAEATAEGAAGASSRLRELNAGAGEGR